ncbi:hypothetical protein, partial [Pseudomonas aeruginosa]|uniref:hypothetical protein n=1 Tax=Pseudomonas aeruginosa TaxID=287 RepID=UPI001C3DF8A5
VEIDLLHFGVGTHHDGTPRENREPSIRDTERSVEDGVYGAHTFNLKLNRPPEPWIKDSVFQQAAGSLRVNSTSKAAAEEAI